jgi:ribosomal protein S1
MMAIIFSLFTRFKKEVETADQQADTELKTHYYKASFNQVFESVEQMFREDADCQITTVSKERGEIAVEIAKPFPCFLIASIVSTSSLETALDFTISTEKFSLIGTYPDLKKRINSYYNRINQIHTNIRIKKNN